MRLKRIEVKRSLMLSQRYVTTQSEKVGDLLLELNPFVWIEPVEAQEAQDAVLQLIIG
ncbi:hypothetical protein [Alicyclobacillus ferrooxydans]|uniref:hypothetical protein n=1 Tax=Alicyclobacillus ferrooxydans TaxID=471514 RepID=UPI000AEFBE9E|nr:hypothetical protein [Alicyclobacillus ferrooxydans]